MLGSLFLRIDTRYNFCEKFSSVILSVSLFSQLWLGLIDCVILMKEYVSLTTAAMKMGKRHLYSDHSKAPATEPLCENFKNTLFAEHLGMAAF